VGFAFGRDSVHPPRSQVGEEQRERDAAQLARRGVAGDEHEEDQSGEGREERAPRRAAAEDRSRQLDTRERGRQLDTRFRTGTKKALDTLARTARL